MVLNRFKKFFAFLLAILIFIVPMFYISASAEGVEQDLLEMILSALLKVHYDIKDINSEIKDYSGDEFYQWWNDSGNSNSQEWKNVLRILQLAQLAEPNGAAVRPGIGKSMTYQGPVLAGQYAGLMDNAKYKSGIVSRRLLNAIDQAAVSGALSTVDFERIVTLDELNLSTTATNIIHCSDVPWCSTSGRLLTDWTNYGTPYINNYSDGHYNFSYMRSYYSGVTTPTLFVYSGNFIPYIHCWNCTLFQNGVKLTGTDFLIVGKSLVIPFNIQAGENIITLGYNSGSNLTDTTFGFAVADKFNNAGNMSSYRRIVSCNIYSGGEVVGTTNTEGFPGYQMVDLVEKMAGFQITVDGKPDIPDTFLPGDIPYDGDGNVVILIPENPDNDIVYMSPDDYDEYITNNYFDEGDSITNDYSSTTINNIMNDYYNATTNNSSSGGDFDDSNILDRLDQIIGWLRDIYNKPSDTPEIEIPEIEVPPTTLPDLFDFLDVEPCYDNFMDCFSNHEFMYWIQNAYNHAYDEISQGDMETVKNDVMGSAINSNFVVDNENNDYVLNGFNSSGGAANLVYYKFQGYYIDFNWYDRYRSTIHTVFQYLAYALGLFSIWKSFKSCFGLVVSSVDTSNNS